MGEHAAVPTDRSGLRFRPPPADPANARRLADFRRAFELLQRTQRASADEMLAAQLDRLRQLLAHCAAHVPYYRQLFDRTGVDPRAIRSLDDVRALPRLERTVYQAERSAFAAERLPAGTRIVGEQLTSGTTGMPIAVTKTNITRLWWFALFLRDLDWCGVDPSASRATIKPFIKPGDSDPELAAGVSLPIWNSLLHELLETGTAHRLDINQPADAQVAWLQTIRPQLLMSYPSNLELLGAHLEATRGRIERLQVVQAVSETLSTAQAARIARQLGARVCNTYSCVEAGYLATSCPEGHGLHVHAESVLLEVLDDDDRPCGPGEAGRVVITALQNFASPLIRYELGDRATLGPAHCPCGRTLPLLAEVEGKVRPIMVRADGSRRSSAEIAQYMQKSLDVVTQYRCVQSQPGRVRLEVVPAARWTEADRVALAGFLDGFIGAGGTAELAIVSHIPRAPGGKHRDIVGLP